MIKGGTGGAHTKTGLAFEKAVDIREAIRKLPNYHILGNDIFFKGKIIGNVYKKHEFYKFFLKKLDIHWESILSKRILPDETIFVNANNTLFVIEMKRQSGEGSVDEKIQTCDFKRYEYCKLLQNTNIKVKYVYLLNDWFKQKKYRDVLEYIKTKDCDYFFDLLPLDYLGLPDPNS